MVTVSRNHLNFVKLPSGTYSGGLSLSHRVGKVETGPQSGRTREKISIATNGSVKMKSTASRPSRPTTSTWKFRNPRKLFEYICPPMTTFQRMARTCTRSRNCLLYTSDAADDLLCVDLGGRRII